MRVGIDCGAGVGWDGLQDGCRLEVLRRVLDFKINGRRGRGRPRKKWRRQVEEQIKKIGMSEEEALN